MGDVLRRECVIVIEDCWMDVNWGEPDMKKLPRERENKGGYV